MSNNNNNNNLVPCAHATNIPVSLLWVVNKQTMVAMADARTRMRLLYRPFFYAAGGAVVAGLLKLFKADRVRSRNRNQSSFPILFSSDRCQCDALSCDQLTSMMGSRVWPNDPNYPLAAAPPCSSLVTRAPRQGRFEVGVLESSSSQPTSNILAQYRKGGEADPDAPLYDRAWLCPICFVVLYRVHSTGPAPFRDLVLMPKRCSTTTYAQFAHVIDVTCPCNRHHLPPPTFVLSGQREKKT